MDEKKQHEEIRKGFNAGYLLEKLNPKLAQKLRSGITDKSSPFLLGMAKGAEQYNQETFFDSPPPDVPDRIEDLNLDSPDNNMEKGKDGKDAGFEP